MDTLDSQFAPPGGPPPPIPKQIFNLFKKYGRMPLVPVTWDAGLLCRFCH